MESDVDITLKKLKEKEININKVINRYMRIKRKKFIRKVLFLGLRSN
jgi:hypothetical protein